MSEPREMTPNEKFLAVLAALQAIADNPAESKARRDKALNALLSATKGSGAAAPVTSVNTNQPTLGNKRGNAFLASNADFQGDSRHG